MRKILNVYLYCDNEASAQQCSFKMRLIEMENIQAVSPEMEVDRMILKIDKRIWPPFAVFLRDELDKYNIIPVNPKNKLVKDSGSLFKTLRDSYTKEIIRHNGECFAYHDIDLLLFRDTGINGNEHRLLQILGALDDAVTNFRHNAETDNYAVNVHFCDNLPVFSRKKEILRDAFESKKPDATHSLSRHVVNWLLNKIEQPELAVSLNPSTLQMADQTLKSLLAASEGDTSLNNAIRSKLSLVHPGSLDTPRPLRAAFFASDIGIAIKPLQDLDLDMESEVKSPRFL